MTLNDRRVWAPEGDGAAPAPAAAPASSPASAPPVAFAEQLPEDIRGEAAFRDIKDLGSLAKSYLHAQKLIGHNPENLLPIPAGDDADGWNRVFEKLGRPETADKYELKAPPLPAGATIDAALLDGFKSKAHEAGLTAKQAAGLFEWYNQQAGGALTAQAQAAEAARVADDQKLRQEWGAAYDQKMQLANRALQHYGDESLNALLLDSGLAKNPAVHRMFAKLGAQLAEDGVQGRGGGDFGGVYSPGEAKQQIAALQRDAAFMKSYMNKSVAGHAEAVKQMQALHEQAFPAPT